MSRKSKGRKSVDRAATTDVVSQLECAIRRPQATLIGALVGGIVPWFARTLAHEEVPTAWSSGSHGLALLMIGVILGCACFSAITVYKFGRATFGDKHKALGFVLAIEGVMLVSHGATSAVALAVLVAINALANGSAIALAREATCKHREAVARATATRRSRTSSSTPAAPPTTRRDPMMSVVVEVDETTVKPPRASRPRTSPHTSIVKVPRWNPIDVEDAEIVSEQRFLA